MQHKSTKINYFFQLLTKAQMQLAAVIMQQANCSAVLHIQSQGQTKLFTFCQHTDDRVFSPLIVM